jgi:hypothetical protein
MLSASDVQNIFSKIQQATDEFADASDSDYELTFTEFCEVCNLLIIQHRFVWLNLYVGNGSNCAIL